MSKNNFIKDISKKKFNINNLNEEEIYYPKKVKINRKVKEKEFKK